MDRDSGFWIEECFGKTRIFGGGVWDTGVKGARQGLSAIQENNFGRVISPIRYEALCTGDSTAVWRCARVSVTDRRG